MSFWNKNKNRNFIVFDRDAIDVIHSLEALERLLPAIEVDERLAILIGLDSAKALWQLFSNAHQADLKRPKADADFLAFSKETPGHIRLGLDAAMIVRRCVDLLSSDEHFHEVHDCLKRTLVLLLDQNVRNFRPAITEQGWGSNLLVLAETVVDEESYFKYVRGLLPEALRYDEDIVYLIDPAYSNMSKEEYLALCGSL